MNKNRTQQQLYIVFWIIIVVLIGLIGWFTYLLIQPDDANTNADTVTNATTTNDTNTNGNKKKKTNNSNASETTTNTNAAATDAVTNEADTADDSDTTDDGLVEPTNDATDTDTDDEATDDDTTTEDDAEAETVTEEDADDADKETVTLYFAKTASACGEVYPVERKIEPSDDPYGQIILEAMHGPSTEETGYTSAVPSGMYLRQVEYTADGALITVSEAYDSLDSCDQETAAAQLIETANAMFELPEGTAGEVVVGTVSDDDEEEEVSEETDSAEDTE